MTASKASTSVRVHLSIRVDTPAYAILATCETPSARRSMALGLMQAAAAAVLIGPPVASFSTSPPVRSAIKPSGANSDSSRVAYTAKSPSSIDAIFAIDFDDL